MIMIGTTKAKNWILSSNKWVISPTPRKYLKFYGASCFFFPACTIRFWSSQWFCFLVSSWKEQVIHYCSLAIFLGSISDLEQHLWFLYVLFMVLKAWSPNCFLPFHFYFLFEDLCFLFSWLDSEKYQNPPKAKKNSCWRNQRTPLKSS